MERRDFVLSEHDASLREMLEKALDTAIKTVERNAKKYNSGELYPIGKYENGRYIWDINGGDAGNRWTEGFWTGQLWLCYELTGKEIFKTVAERSVRDFYKRVDENIHIDWHHDTGFLYTLSCVSAYKLTGNELANRAAKMAAYSLSRRFRKKGEFIQNSQTEINADNYKFIIDTMMNLPLLFWMAEQTGEESYRQKALKHAETTRKYIIREDGSTYHHYLMDYKTGAPIRGLTLQGAGDESCWTRGQAWMVYAAPLMYDFTGDESWIETFERVTDYFIEHLPADCIPYWDFDMTDIPGEPRDSSAAAIAACGIMEMAKYLPSEHGKMEKYIEFAKKMLISLVKNYATFFEDGDEALLLHVTGSKPHGSADISAVYGDYFYLEALVRATCAWERYW